MISHGKTLFIRITFIKDHINKKLMKLAENVRFGNLFLCHTVARVDIQLQRTSMTMHGARETAMAAASSCIKLGNSHAGTQKASLSLSLFLSIAISESSTEAEGFSVHDMVQATQNRWFLHGQPVSPLPQTIRNEQPPKNSKTHQNQSKNKIQQTSQKPSNNVYKKTAKTLKKYQTSSQKKKEQTTFEKKKKHQTHQKT